MRAKHLIKKSIILGIIFLTIIGFIFPSTLASVETDPDDGVWMDDFENAAHVNLTNCIIENGVIALTRSKNIINYSFADTRSHKAYSYVAPLFLPLLFSPPDSHIRWEDEFNKYTELKYIKTPNGEYAERSSEGLKRYVVHHFRFKLDAKAEDIGNLCVNWFGNATDDKRINLYLWMYYSEQTRLGFWSQLGHNLSGERKGDVILSSDIIPHDNVELALNEDNYLDICVVVIPKSTTCTLYTDYVEIFSETIEGYTIGRGTATTKNYIEPKTISNVTDFYWDVLTWDDYERGGAKAKYHVYYDANETEENETLVKVEDKYFYSSDGSNEDGFTESPICLNKISYDKIKILANLSTDTHLASPKIFSWAVTWQTNVNRWQDLFNYTYRIDVKNKLNFSSDGNISIDPITDDWPMFGQNPQNTRSSEGKGPDDNELNWYSEIDAEETILNPVIINPVIRDGVLYATYLNSDQLYIYNNIIRPEDEYVKEYDVDVDLNTDKWVVNSPTITEDFIIIATGKTDNDGTENYVIALDKTKPKNEPKWKFEYDEDICYSSSPVVYDDKVFVTSWSGDPDPLQSNKNNKVIALYLSSGSEVWDHPFDLPAGSFSTPAVYKNMVFVGCNKKSGNSLFAIDAESGDSIWNKSVGAIDGASPVVYNDSVFIVSKEFSKTKVTALSAENGSIKWEFIIDHLHAVADTTPAIYDDVLYVASPNGYIYALNISNVDKPLWKQQVYTRGIGNFLVTSPAYAEGVVYIGTPTGTFYALDASDGEIKWAFETFEPRDNFAVTTSPIVSNGLVFFGDENGKLYSVGSYKKPGQEITGSLVSIPINLPEHRWWDKFYARDDTSTDNSDNSITFSILDENKNFIGDIQNGKKIAMEDTPIDRTIRLRADLYAKNSSVNPHLWDWWVTFVVDSNPPVFNSSTFTPNPEGWLNEIPSVFSVKIKDDKTGLLVSSVQYVLKYSIGNESKTTPKIDAYCSGDNGTTDEETIIANISKLDFYKNITELHSISISIYDLAGNKATLPVSLTIDADKPSSYIINTSIKETYNSEDEHVIITAIAKDDISGIQKVELWYRYSNDNIIWGDWDIFEEKSGTTPTWEFTVKKGEGGFYELYTIAEDNAHNVEDEKEEGDVSFIFDPNPPTMPIFTEPYFFNTTAEFSIKFTDDFLLDTIEYRPNFEMVWEIIESDINETTYNSPWTLLQKYWDQMEEGEKYYLYFRLTDSVGNINTIVDTNEAIAIIKDISEPTVDLEIPDLEGEWSWDDTFTISAYADDRNGSDIESVELYYRYSEDNTNWDNWTKYKDKLTSAPFEWEFKAEEGNGYYEFYMRAKDAAGNVAESEVFSTGLNIFPLIFVVAMVVLVIALLIITTALFRLWGKKKG